MTHTVGTTVVRGAPYGLRPYGLFQWPGVEVGDQHVKRASGVKPKRRRRKAAR